MPSNKPKILLVDDDPDNLELLKTILTPVDADLITAENGVEAFKEALAHDNLALAILDVQMPKMDGYQLAELMREEEKTKDIPVIFISAIYTDDRNKFRGYDAGAVDFLPVPYNPKVMLQKVKVFLGLAKQRERLDEILREQKENNERVKNEFAERMAVECALADEKERFSETEKKWAEEKLAQTSQVLESSIEGIVITDAEGTIQQVNPAFTDITGYSAQEAVGKNPRILRSDRHDKDFFKKMWEEILTTGKWEGEIWNRRKNGEVFLEHLSITSVKNREGKISNFVSLFHDITENKQREEQLKFLAYHDTLTGLPNRLLFKDRLTHGIVRAKRAGETLAVMFLDVDLFKKINESLGHPVGDLLLQEVGSRLLQCIREGDTLSRHGGDEFSILLENAETAQVEEVAKRINKKISEPFTLDKEKIYVTASIGITYFPIDGESSETLLKNADMAMYRAKEKGRNNFKLFTASMNEKAEKKMKLENDLRKALEWEEFVVYYQPKVDLSTGLMVGMEALVRWNSPERGFVSPGDFIPIAEDTGLVVPLGNFVLRKACEQTKEWLDTGRIPSLRVSVNLSTRQFEQKDLTDMVKSVLGDTGLPPGNLCLEITEGTVVRDVESAINTLHALKKMGVYVSIDDFGTGHSSLSYLRRFPLDELKIDRSFVLDISQSREARAIAEFIISMGRALEFKVVAEGVETPEQLKFLREYKCHEMQGFLYSKPLSARDFSRLMREGKKLFSS